MGAGMSILQGKVAVITGASAGIGASIARELATAGVKFVIAARRQDRLEALAKELSGDVAVFAADVAKPEVPAQLLAFARQRFGAADILINNAGIFRIGSLADFDLDAIAPMSALNYDAVVRASYVFARAMKAAGSGAIVNISSIGAHLTAPGAGVYGGLKRALEIFTDSLRIELAGSGVKVGLVAPGSTATEIFDHMKVDGELHFNTEVEPLQAEDIARAVRYLLEDRKSTRLNSSH